MPSTFQALAVALLALLPGASYTFAYERVVGSFGVSLADRLIRFLVVSGVFGALLAAPGLIAYRDVIVTGRLASGEVNALVVEGVALAYLLLPTVAGAVIGHGQLRDWRLVSTVIGSAPQPRAWDYLWRPGPRAWYGCGSRAVPGSPESSQRPETSDVPTRPGIPRIRISI